MCGAGTGRDFRVEVRTSGRPRRNDSERMSQLGRPRTDQWNRLTLEPEKGSRSYSQCQGMPLVSGWWEV